MKINEINNGLYVYVVKNIREDFKLLVVASNRQ